MPAGSQPQPTASDAALAKAAELHMRGRELLAQGMFTEAIKLLSEAIKLDPDLTLAYNARGFAYLKLKRYAPAMADFNKALRPTPIAPPSAGCWAMPSAAPPTGRERAPWEGLTPRSEPLGQPARHFQAYPVHAAAGRDE